MDIMEKGWFTEISELWPNQRFSFRVQKILHREQSKYQDILILKSESHGLVLVLDNIIQCSESDEFAYQEMISFLPLNCHNKPEKVLIVGGGDGGVAREVQKHPSVESFVQVEIDGRVVELSKQYLPFMAEGFKSSKLTLLIEDGLKYLKNHINEFDVIITDSSDPIGPAVCLFTAEYFDILSKALKPNGIICSQGGNPFNCTDQVKEMIRMAKTAFSNVSYAYSSVPTYPSGQIGYLLATNNNQLNFEKPKTIFTEEQKNNMKLKYYDENIHYAAFQLPRFIKQLFNS